MPSRHRDALQELRANSKQSLKCFGSPKLVIRRCSGSAPTKSLHRYGVENEKNLWSTFEGFVHFHHSFLFSETCNALLTTGSFIAFPIYLSNQAKTMTPYDKHYGTDGLMGTPTLRSPLPPPSPTPSEPHSPKPFTQASDFPNRFSRTASIAPSTMQPFILPTQ